MKYQFRPYAKMQPTEVTLTGKVYEKGEHPLYTEHKIIEVVDEQGEMHYAFEDELKSNEVEKQQQGYSEEEAKMLAFDFYYDMSHKMGVAENLISENVTNVDVWFEQFKKK